MYIRRSDTFKSLDINLFISTIELTMKAISYISTITRLNSSICKYNCHVCFLSILANRHHTLCLFPEFFRIVVILIPAYQSPIPSYDMVWINVCILQFFSMCFQNSVNSVKNGPILKTEDTEIKSVRSFQHKEAETLMRSHDTSNS